MKILSFFIAHLYGILQLFTTASESLLDSRTGFVAGSSERQQGNRQIIQFVIS